MPKFELKNVDQVVGKYKMYKLSIDDHCQFDEFHEQIIHDGNMKSDLAALFRILQSVSDGQRLPEKKFRTLKGFKDIKEYEAKKNSLRVYMIEEPGGHMIILGGKKGSQNKDIKRFREIKDRYLENKKK